MEKDTNEDRERIVARTIYSVFLRWFVLAFLSGSGMAAIGEAILARVTNGGILVVGTWLVRLGVGIATCSFAMAVCSWFWRATTQEEVTFKQQQLQKRYRVVAWSLVFACAVIFACILWFTLSRGLASW